MEFQLEVYIYKEMSEECTKTTVLTPYKPIRFYYTLLSDITSHITIVPATQPHFTLVLFPNSEIRQHG